MDAKEQKHKGVMYACDSAWIFLSRPHPLPHLRPVSADTDRNRVGWMISRRIIPDSQSIRTDESGRLSPAALAHPHPPAVAFPGGLDAGSGGDSGRSVRSKSS
jgi:hypothetical protein